MGMIDENGAYADEQPVDTGTVTEPEPPQADPLAELKRLMEQLGAPTKVTPEQVESAKREFIATLHEIKGYLRFTLPDDGPSFSLGRKAKVLQALSLAVKMGEEFDWQGQYDKVAGV